MKVAVTAEGNDAKSRVHPRFGRAPWFVVVDTESGSVEAVDNSTGIDASSGAGVQAAQRISSTGAEYLLTGHCGPNAFRTLEAAGIKVAVGVDGTVEDAVRRFEAGEFSDSTGPDVGGHW